MKAEWARRRLSTFVEQTCGFSSLDLWQKVLCARLERLRHETGQRLLIHAPPQMGKSVIVSQRFPAWMLGHAPSTRIKLASYNISQSTRFSKVVRGVMQSHEYATIFPRGESRIVEPSMQEEWFTVARAGLRDSQPSYKALGLETGFVGQGADLLIIDDPYSSANDAESLAYRWALRLFWFESAKVRLNDATNVVVMFHRYRTDDFAGMLIEEEGLRREGGKWEELRFAAQCDDPENDPLHRALGEYLSPRYSDAWYEEQKSGGFVWDGQFQGSPVARKGGFFNVNLIETIDALPAGVTIQWCRAWDLAGTENDGDYTVGFLLGRGSDGFWYIADVVYGQWDTNVVETTIVNTAKRDRMFPNVKIHLPQDPGQAGKSQVQQLIAKLAGFNVVGEPISGSKATRAFGWSSQINAGNAKMLSGAWNHFVRSQYEAFPRGKDDVVDAGSDAFNVLASVLSTSAKMPLKPASANTTTNWRPFK